LWKGIVASLAPAFGAGDEISMNFAAMLDAGRV
jgi:hypothetical protein